MTKLPPVRCAWCGERFQVGDGPGRPPKYCRRSHRQRAYEARQVASDRGLGADEVLLAASTWVELRDAIFILEAAARDAEADLDDTPDRRELAAIAASLVDVIDELVALRPEPKAVGSSREV